MTRFPTSSPYWDILKAQEPGRRCIGSTGLWAIVTLVMFGVVMMDALTAERRIWAQTIAAPADPAETRTQLIVLTARNDSGKPGEARQVVALGHPIGGKNKVDTLGTIQGILERELVRQALLIAARDEMSLATRDEILDDEQSLALARGPGENQNQDGPVEIAIVFRPAECRAVLRRGEGDKAKILRKYDLGTNPDGGGYSAALTARAEALSRTEFPAILKQLGARGEPNKLGDAAPLPPEVEERLDSLSMVDAFAAVRMLHQTIRTDGESAVRVAALARAYAILGVLTEFHWSPAHRAFKARALLYAERLIARNNMSKSAEALRTRAFVRALVGRHDLALADLDASNKLSGGGPGARAANAAPPWLPVIESYLKVDRQGLAIKDRPYARLASLLSMMVVEYPSRTRLIIEAARAVVSIDANCYRAYDAICENGDLGDLHAATELAPEAFARLFPTNLKSLAMLPESVKKLLEQGGSELNVIGELQQAGRAGEDTGEPSWGVLAHLTRETRFVHTWRRLHFMARKWNVPVDDYFAEIRPLVASHRYFPYLESFTLPRLQIGRVINAFAEKLDLTDIEPTARYMIDDLRDLKLPAGEMAWRLSLAHCSILVRDIAERLRQTGDKKAHFGKVLLIISPYSAFAMGTLVAADWDRVKDDVPAWRKKVNDAPALIGALGKKYAALKQYVDAEKCLSRYVELSADEWAYQELAACYEASGDRARAKEIIDHYLTKTESAGLKHAQVQVQMANKFMKQGRWQEAKPYAEAAAATWAAFGMICASECAEGLKEWDEAELWMRRVSERYPTNSWARWYIFCKRTGQGDLKAARALAEEHLTEVAGTADREEATQAGMFYWSAGSSAKALEFMDKSFTTQPSMLNGVARILLADEIGDRARCGKMLDEVSARFQGKVPKLVAVCKLIHESLTGGDDTPLDLAAVDKVLNGMPGKNRVNADFLVGRYLFNHRRTDSARKYLDRCKEADAGNKWVQLLATEALRSVDSGKK